MKKITFKFASLPNGATAETPVKIEQFSFESILDARKEIIKQRLIHQQQSIWYKIYNGEDDVIFNSYLIHGSKTPPKQLKLQI